MIAELGHFALVLALKVRDVRAASRSNRGLTDRYSVLGFRCARSR